MTTFRISKAKPSRRAPEEVTRGVASTDGRGNWSTAKKSIQFFLEAPSSIGIDHYTGRPRYHGSMNAYFDPREWNTQKLGLIYTDRTFLKGVRDALKKAGFKYPHDLEYSEQGAQGDVYVNFDIGDGLARELVDKGFVDVEED